MGAHRFAPVMTALCVLSFGLLAAAAPVASGASRGTLAKLAHDTGPCVQPDGTDVPCLMPTVTVTDDASTAAVGESFAFTATVTGYGTTPVVTPSGNVSWSIRNPAKQTQACDETAGPTVIGHSEVFTCTVSDVLHGTYTATVSYLGDPTYIELSAKDSKAAVSWVGVDPLEFPSAMVPDANQGNAIASVDAVTPAPDGSDSDWIYLNGIAGGRGWFRVISLSASGQFKLIANNPFKLSESALTELGRTSTGLNGNESDGEFNSGAITNVDGHAWFLTRAVAKKHVIGGSGGHYFFVYETSLWALAPDGRATRVATGNFSDLYVTSGGTAYMETRLYYQHSAKLGIERCRLSGKPAAHCEFWWKQPPEDSSEIADVSSTRIWLTVSTGQVNAAGNGLVQPLAWIPAAGSGPASVHFEKCPDGSDECLLRELPGGDFVFGEDGNGTYTLSASRPLIQINPNTGRVLHSYPKVSFTPENPIVTVAADRSIWMVTSAYALDELNPDTGVVTTASSSTADENILGNFMLAPGPPGTDTLVTVDPGNRLDVIHWSPLLVPQS